MLWIKKMASKPKKNFSFLWAKKERIKQKTLGLYGGSGGGIGITAFETKSKL